MSKVWGSGFHKGKQEGFSNGIDQGHSGGVVVGQLYASEHAWHCVNASIRALENDESSEALGILRVLKFMLAEATGHDAPKISPSKVAE